MVFISVLQNVVKLKRAYFVEFGDKVWEFVWFPVKRFLYSVFMDSELLFVHNSVTVSF